MDLSVACWECQNHLLAKLVRIAGELIVVLCDVSWKGKLLPIALPRVQGKFPGQYLHTKSEGAIVSAPAETAHLEIEEGLTPQLE